MMLDKQLHGEALLRREALGGTYTTRSFARVRSRAIQRAHTSEMTWPKSDVNFDAFVELVIPSRNVELTFTTQRNIPKKPDHHLLNT